MLCGQQTNLAVVVQTDQNVQINYGFKLNHTETQDHTFSNKHTRLHVARCYKDTHHCFDMQHC